jgi:hypothetical protein
MPAATTPGSFNHLGSVDGSCMQHTVPQLPPAGASRLRDDGPIWPAKSGCVFQPTAQPSQDPDRATRGLNGRREDAMWWPRAGMVGASSTARR